jgi:predicted nucleic acid-binding Zn ribbon protein
MPTYIYKFIETGETIEVQQAFSDASLTEAVHPGTGSTMPVKKVFTPVGVTFKGGGFYKTDSRGGKSSSTTPSSTSSESGSTASSSSSGDSGSSSSSSDGSSSSSSSSSSAASTPSAPSTSSSTATPSKPGT